MQAPRWSDAANVGHFAPNGKSLMVPVGSTVFGIALIQVAGAEPGSLLPANLPILLDDLVDASIGAADVSGKAVMVISSVGTDDEYVDLFVYDQGDTIWMVQGPGDVIEVTLDGLPDPR